MNPLSPRQVMIIIFMLIVFFALPAFITTLVIDGINHSKGGSLIIDKPFVEVMKSSIIANPDIYFIVATISFVAFILLIVALVQYKKKKVYEKQQDELFEKQSQNENKT